MNLIERSKHNRRTFNPQDKNDMEEYAYFLKNRKWRNGCPFLLDWPYLTVPDMIKDRVVRQYLSI